MDASEPVTPWRRIHPASVWVNLVPRTLRLLWSFWPVLVVIVFGRGEVRVTPLDLVVIPLALLTGSLSSFIHYATLRYRIHAGRLEVRQGILHRHDRIIDPGRIQNVELIRNPFHKIAGLVELRVETAGESRVEGMLSALTVEEARRVIREIDEARGMVVEEEEPTLREVQRQGAGELFAYGLTSSGLGFFVVVLLVGVQLVELGVADKDVARSLVDHPAQIAGLVLLGLVLSWVITGFTSMFRHWDHRLVLAEEGLRTEEGLITRRSVEIPERKVQLVEADEPFLRRQMGYGTVSVETAGLGSVVQGRSRAEAVIPMVERQSLGEIFSLAIPHARMDPWHVTLLRPHPKALDRALVELGVTVIFFTGIATGLGGVWGLATLLLLPLGALSAWLDFRFQAWLVTPNVLVSRRGFWRRRTWMVARDKVQSVHLEQGPLMRFFGLGRLYVKVADGAVALPEISMAQASALQEDLRSLSIQVAIGGEE